MASPLRALTQLYREAFGGLPARTWLLCTAAFLNRCGSMVVPFLGPYLKDGFAYTPSQAGLVVGLYGIGAFLGSWLGGWLTDRLGAVRLQVLALASAALWMWLMLLCTEPWSFVPAVFVLGVCNDAFRPGSNTAAAQSAPPELRRKALSLNRFALNLGWAVGPTLGGYLVARDFRWMFVVDGATCGLAALWLWWRLGDWRPAAPRPAAATPVAGAAIGQGQGHERPFADRHFVLLMGANLLVLLAFMQYFTTGTRVFVDQGYTPQQVGWFLAVNPILITLLEMPVVHGLRGRRALPVVALGSLVVGLGHLGLLFGGATAVVLAMVVVALGELLQMPLLGAHVNDHAPDHARGAYNGAYGMTFTLALVLAPVLGGVVYDTCGATMLWWGCALSGALGALGFWRLSGPGAAAARQH
ncbi:MAG: MFS transporter [Planctomycetes bacterium]|nr:MFS transporter [Planctomycetota bacterium]